MMKHTLLILFALSLVHSGKAQSMEELKSMKAKAEYVGTRPEDLDRMVQQLRGFTPTTSEEREALQELRRSISSSYAANNHYRPAYREYLNYLSIKEEGFRNDRQSALEAKNAALQSRLEKIDQEQQSTRETADDLETSAARYSSFRSNYKRFFSAAIIALSALFGLSLFRSGLRLRNMRSSTEESRTNLTDIHRVALLGKLSKGNREQHRNYCHSELNALRELKAKIQSSGGQGQAEVLSSIKTVEMTLEKSAAQN